MHIYKHTDAQANAGEGVRLADYDGDKIDLAGVKGISECIQLASNPEVVSEMEDLVSIWSKQIEQVSENMLFELLYTMPYSSRIENP